MKNYCRMPMDEQVHVHESVDLNGDSTGEGNV